ncbi:MAG: phosphohistidine phosphatase SixA [Halioglobus sp.]
MIISIFRHGEAANAPMDSERVLSAQGERDVALAAQRFEAACGSEDNPSLVKPEVVLYSPYVRTRQTAEIVSARFPSIVVQASPALTPEGHVHDVEKALEDLADSECAHVVLVSHQPLVSYLSNHWIHQAENVPSMIPGALTVFSMATVGALCGELLFWASPPTYEFHK